MSKKLSRSDYDDVRSALANANWRILGELEAENARLDRRRELAEIDRRAAEQELDMVRALGYLEGRRHADQQRKRIDELENELGELGEERQAYAAAWEMERKRIEELEAELEAARDDVHNSQMVLRKTEERLAVEEARAEKLYRRIEELEARNKLLEAENQSVHEAMKVLLQTVEARDTQLANLDGVTEELDAAKRRIRALEGKPNHPNLRDADGDLWVWARHSDDHEGYFMVEPGTELSHRDYVESEYGPIKEERWVTFQ